MTWSGGWGGQSSEEQEKETKTEYLHTKESRSTFSQMEAEVERKNYQKGQTLKDLKGKFRIIT